MTILDLLRDVRQTGLAAVCGVALALSPITLAPVTSAAAAPDSFADLAEELSDVVVNISTISRVEVRRPNFPQLGPGSPFEEFLKPFQRENNDEPQEREARSLGSGFVIDPAGYVVTNNHVIDGAAEITVRFSDDKEYDAEVIGTDPEGDIALLKIQADKKFSYTKWGNSDETRVGDWVMAIGNPFGLGGTVTAGILSARHRNINAGPFDDYLQTDASINRGNSGGPMFNMAGEVIGVNTAILSPTGGNVGIGLAIPSNQARYIVDQLKETGKVQRGWLGIGAQDVTKDIAESLGLKDDKGALVSSVNDGGPASKAGFVPGDVILALDGKSVDSLNRLLIMLGRAEVGKTIPVRIFRDGKEKVLTVTLGERKSADILAATSSGPGSKNSSKTSTILGLELKSLTKDELSELGIETETGVIVARVRSGSDAARKGLLPGDLIDQANNKPVASLDALRDEIESVKESGREKILVRIYRQAADSYLHFAIEIADES